MDSFTMNNNITQQNEVDKNFEIFLKKLPKIIEKHIEQFALMHDGKNIGYFSTFEDARTAAEIIYGDSIYSIQEVTTTPIDLGYFSHAVVFG